MRKPCYKKPSPLVLRVAERQAASPDSRRESRDQEAAETKYHELMADRQPPRKDMAGATPVRELIDRLLVWNQEHRSEQFGGR